MTERVVFKEERNIYRLVHTILLSGTLVCLAGNVVGVYELSLFHMILGIVFAMGTSVFFAFFDKKKVISTFVVMVFLGVAVGISGWQDVLYLCRSYVKWLFGISGWDETLWKAYYLIQLCLVIFVIHLLQRWLDRYFAMHVFPAIVMAAGLIYLLLSKTEVTYPGVVCSVCYIVLIVIEWTQKNWEKKKNKAMEQYMLWIVPFVACYFAVMLCMPVSEKPYDWSEVKAAYHFLNEKIDYLVNQELRYRMKDIFHGSEEYKTVLSGFSEDAELRGNVGKSEELVMTLKSDQPLKTNVYLIGKIYNHFDGIEWTAKQDEFKAERYIDSIHTALAAGVFGKENVNNYVANTDLEICYENVTTDFVFAPMKTFRLEDSRGYVKPTGYNGSLIFSKRKRYGYKYLVKYFQINRGDPLFEEFLEEETEYDICTTDRMQSRLKLLSDTYITAQELEAYVEYCHDNYSQVPPLSSEVEEYLEEITQGAETRQERLKAIEKELSSYKYNLSPNALPVEVTDAQAFLDYFLLESREGYCTHFATAFILLARAEGFPARYVQGYCVPMAGKRQMDVTSAMAHGWPEVFIDGIGWIPFEPTPGNGELVYASWEAPEMSAPEDDNKAEEYYERYKNEEEMILQAEEKEEKREAQAQKLKDAMKKAGMFLLIGGLLSIFVLGVAICILYKRMNFQQRYFYRMRQNLWLLAEISQRKKESETLNEYAEKVAGFLPERTSMKFLYAYEEVIYGDREIDEELMRLTEEAGRTLLLAFRDKYRWNRGRKR